MLRRRNAKKAAKAKADEVTTYWLKIQQGGQVVDEQGPYSYRKAAAVEAKKMAGEAAGTYYNVIEHTTQGDRGPFGRKLEVQNSRRRRNRKADYYSDVRETGVLYRVWGDTSTGRWTKWTTLAEARAAARHEQHRHPWARFGVQRLGKDNDWHVYDPLGSFVAAPAMAMAANSRRRNASAKAQLKATQKKLATAQKRLASTKARYSKQAPSGDAVPVSRFCGSMTPYAVVTGYSGGDITIDIIEKVEKKKANRRNPKLSKGAAMAKYHGMPSPARHIAMRKDLRDGIIGPSVVIGGGYKSSATARKVALQWLDEQIAAAGGKRNGWASRALGPTWRKEQWRHVTIHTARANGHILEVSEGSVPGYLTLRIDDQVLDQTRMGQHALANAKRRLVDEANAARRAYKRRN